MIHLESLAMAHSLDSGDAKVVLRPTTVALPTDRKLAILGPDPRTKSLVLRLLSGVEAPAQGRVNSTTRLSPIIKYATLFHHRLSFLENIEFCANMLNVNSRDLALLLDTGCNSYPSSEEWEKSSERDRRIAAEVAMLTLFPFDCYLVDEIAFLPEAVREWLFDLVVQRPAGIIFACTQPGLVRRYADCAVVIHHGVVYPFSDIEEALAFHGK